jgi:hypothetical protein
MAGLSKKAPLVRRGEADVDTMVGMIELPVVGKETKAMGAEQPIEDWAQVPGTN